MAINYSIIGHLRHSPFSRIQNYSIVSYHGLAWNIKKIVIGLKYILSTRKTNFISLDNLIDEVGPDVVKYFFAMRGINSHLNFDLGLAKDQSEQNPVFYIQYAHARSVSIINKSKNEDLYLIEKFNYNLLTKSEEIDFYNLQNNSYNSFHLKYMLLICEKISLK